MDEKKLDQVANLEDAQLDDVSGGARVLSAEAEAEAGEGEDTRGGGVFGPFPWLNSSAPADEGGEEVDGVHHPFPHLSR